MKRKISFILCTLLVLSATVAYAAVSFSSFTMTFTGLDNYQNITSDTTSKAMKTADSAYARLYITATNSSKNNVYRTYYNGYVSDKYFKKTTAGTWMYYTSNVPKSAKVYLRGRPDSDVPNSTVTGSFGAG